MQPPGADLWPLRCNARGIDTINAIRDLMACTLEMPKVWCSHNPERAARKSLMRRRMCEGVGWEGRSWENVMQKGLPAFELGYGCKQPSIKEEALPHYTPSARKCEPDRQGSWKIFLPRCARGRRCKPLFGMPRMPVYALIPVPAGSCPAEARKPPGGWREDKAWSQRADSNRGPADYESAALPAELRWRRRECSILFFGAQEGRPGRWGAEMQRSR